MQFNYVAYNIQQGVVRGRIEAESEAFARTEVLKLGYKPLHIKQMRKPLSLEEMFPSLFGVGTPELVRFFRQTATMLASGGGLVRTLEMLQDESRNRVMKRILADVRKTLDEGGSLSEALANHPRVFNTLLISVVEVGEHTGRLGPALEQMADILEKEHQARQKAIQTLMYPMAIMGLSLVTMFVLMTVALPPLLTLFNNLGTEVPLMTKIAILFATGMKAHFLKVIFGIVALFVALAFLRRVPRFRHWIDKVRLRVPVMGAFTITGELSRFSRTCSMLLEAGVPLATGLKLGLNSCKNSVVQNAFREADESLMSGHSLADALKRHKFLPGMFVQLVKIGEESNSLRRTLSDAADAYEKQQEQRLSSILNMLEPASTVVVGAIVGFIALSMFLPIYSGLGSIK